MEKESSPHTKVSFKPALGLELVKLCTKKKLNEEKNLSLKEKRSKENLCQSQPQSCSESFTFLECVCVCVFYPFITACKESTLDKQLPYFDLVGGVGNHPRNCNVT